jgi:hypothetical protein
MEETADAQHKNFRVTIQVGAFFGGEDIQRIRSGDRSSGWEGYSPTIRFISGSPPYESTFDISEHPQRREMVDG